MESQSVEYKQDISKGSGLKAEISSFLNTTGGKIYLGVDDNGVPVGFETKEMKLKKYKEWEELLSNWISNSFKPDITGLVFLDPNAEVFTITVSAGPNKPYYFTNGEGMNYKGIYLRVGSSKRLASDDEVRKMLVQNSEKSFDSETIEQRDLSFSYVKQVFTTLDKSFDLIGLEMKKSKDSKYNRAALIVSDSNPFISKAAIFQGLNTITFKDKKRFDGSIVKQIDEALSYIHLNNQIQVNITGDARREEQYAYPEEAVREALLNAYVHRNYTMTADIRIEMYDDRLEIFSPGSLPDGLTVEDIQQGANSKRNPILINALDKMEYIENYGSGIRRIFVLYQNFPRKPKLFATENLFSITLYNRNYRLNSMEPNDKLFAIVEYLSDGKRASRAEIQDILNLEKSQTINLIAKLKKEGIISSEGQSTATKYRLL